MQQPRPENGGVKAENLLRERTHGVGGGNPLLSLLMITAGVEVIVITRCSAGTMGTLSQRRAAGRGVSSVTLKLTALINRPVTLPAECPRFQTTGAHPHVHRSSNPDLKLCRVQLYIFACIFNYSCLQTPHIGSAGDIYI